MRFLALLAAIAGCLALAGCGVDSEVSRADVEKNKRDFSQEAYEKAMIDAGKGAELEAEKARAKERQAQEGGQ